MLAKNLNRRLKSSGSLGKTINDLNTVIVKLVKVRITENGLREEIELARKQQLKPMEDSVSAVKRPQSNF